MSADTRLRETLARLRDLLARSGEAYWSNCLAEALKEPCDKALARTAQDWFADPGGLGGFVFLPAANHAIPSCAVDAANRAFIALRREAFELSHVINAP